MSEPACVVVLTALPSAEDAAAFARALVADRLAACVTVLGEGRAIYQWKGALTEDAEQQLLIKTRADRVADLEARVLALHSYEVPEFVVLPVIGGTAAYLAWVRESAAPGF